MPDQYRVRIGPGTQVVYRTDDGERTGVVRNIDPERELIEVSGVPGVLRMRDIVAAGVYADEAEFHLDPDGTPHARITPPQPPEDHP